MWDSLRHFPNSCNIAAIVLLLPTKRRTNAALEALSPSMLLVLLLRMEIWRFLEEGKLFLKSRRFFSLLSAKAAPGIACFVFLHQSCLDFSPLLDQPYFSCLLEFRWFVSI